jgi:hypothetical protein
MLVAMSLLARQSDGRRRDGCRAVCSRSRLTAECRSRPTSKRVLLSVAPYDADRLFSATRVPVRAMRGAVTQLDSRLVRQQRQCGTKSGRTRHVEAARSNSTFTPESTRVCSRCPTYRSVSRRIAYSHSTVSERVGPVCLRRRQRHLQLCARALTSSLIHDSCGRDTASQSAREEIVPAKRLLRYGLIGPSLRALPVLAYKAVPYGHATQRTKG